MLTRVKIERFKCLRDVDVQLGPFNVLIGPNDAGKSSFLQAIGEPQRWHSAEQRRLQQVFDAKPSIRIWSKTSDARLFFDERGVLWRGIGARKQEANTMGGVLHNYALDEPFMRISEPLMLEPTAVARPSPRGSGVLSKLIETRGQGAAAHLARVALGNRKLYDAIEKGMQDVTGGRIEEVVVGEDTGQGYPLSFRMYDGTVIQASELSQGLLVFFAFLCIVHRDDAPAVLLIEEPENGVHPLRLYEIVRMLRSLTERGVQIIMTTHSPDLLSSCEPEEVLVFRRPNRDSGTEVKPLPQDFKRRAMGDTLGQVWASTGEEGLLDMLPKNRARRRGGGVSRRRAHHPARRGRARRREEPSRRQTRAAV